MTSPLIDSRTEHDQEVILGTVLGSQPHLALRHGRAERQGAFANSLCVTAESFPHAASSLEAAEKAKTLNAFVRMVEGDGKFSLLTVSVYRLLTLWLSMSAQYNRKDFWVRWLSTAENRAEFVRAVRDRINDLYLSPQHHADRWDDVFALLAEHNDWSDLYDGSAGAAWLTGQVERLRVAADKETEAAERATLARLLGKYGVPPGYAPLPREVSHP